MIAKKKKKMTTTKMTTRRPRAGGRPDPRPMRLLLGASAVALSTALVGAVAVDSGGAGNDGAEGQTAAASMTDASTTYLVLTDPADSPMKPGTTAARPERQQAQRKMPTTKSKRAPRRPRARTRQSGG